MSSAKNILVTGGAGFIASNFISNFLKAHPAYRIVNLDKLTYAGDLSNLDGLEKNKRYQFIHGDICNENLVNDIFLNYKIDAVIHFAAESHVDNSINSPNSFIKTNIEGTFVLLEVARKYWLSGNKYINTHRFFHISTDEVYGSLTDKGYFTEESPYAPNSPYSASKASADFLVRSYHKTYGLNTVISNCSNNFGPKQHDEKLIPTIIRKALANEPIPIYGKGTNIRDWLYVEDHCLAIDLLFHKGKAGETYVVGADNECTNLYLANEVCDLMDELIPKSEGSYKDQITFVKDRLGHDYRYAIDSSKIRNELKWAPKQDFIEGLRKTVNWYIKKYQKV